MTDLQVHVVSYESLHRFGLMHVIATNICVWIRTLTHEVMEDFYHVNTDSHYNSSDNHLAAEVQASTRLLTGWPSTWSGSPGKLRICSACTEENCSFYRGILRTASPYIFPFVLEYSLTAMAILTTMYLSISQENDGSLIQSLKHFCRFQIAGESDETYLKNGGTFRQSHRGLFAGVILFSAVVICIVLLSFQINDEEDSGEGDMIYVICDLVLHSFLLVGSIVAIIRLDLLSFVAKSASADDILLILAMGGSVLFEICISMASADYLSDFPNNEREILRLTASIVAAIQSIVQSLAILSGIRRYTSKKSQEKTMPGRELMMFLLVGNITVWVFRTISVGELPLDAQVDYYGQFTWLFLRNLTLPLLLFYRFHSSACLADIWHVAYTPLGKKMLQKTGSGIPNERIAGESNSGNVPATRKFFRSASMPQMRATNLAQVHQLEDIEDLSAIPSPYGNELPSSMNETVVF